MNKIGYITLSICIILLAFLYTDLRRELKIEENKNSKRMYNMLMIIKTVHPNTIVMYNQTRNIYEVWPK